MKKAINKIYRIIKQFMKHMDSCHVGAYASSCAFFLFLSLIPIIVVVCSVIPYTPLTRESLILFIADVFPDAVVPIMKNIVYEVYANHVALLSIGALAAIWSAGKGVMAFTMGLDCIYEVERKRNYFILRVRGSFYTLVILLSVIVTLSVITFGKVVSDIVVSYFPALQYLFEFLLSIRSILLIVVMEVVFVIIYAFVPGQKQNWRHQLPGALFASVGWAGLAHALSIYVNEFAGLTTYGSLSTVVLVMLWMYFAMYIVLIGATMNAFLDPATASLIARREKRTKAYENEISG